MADASATKVDPPPVDANTLEDVLCSVGGEANGKKTPKTTNDEEEKEKRNNALEETLARENQKVKNNKKIGDEKISFEYAHAEFSNLDAILDAWTEAADGRLSIFTVASLTHKRSAFVRAFAIMFLQMFILPGILINSASSSNKNFCHLSPWSSSWIMKLCGASFMVYITFMFFETHDNFMGVKLPKCSSKQAIYDTLFNSIPPNAQLRFFKFHGQPKCANTWFILGLYVRIFANFISGLGAILVLYDPAISPLPLNLVLNSVAIGFINNLDADVVVKKDRRYTVLAALLFVSCFSYA